ncbi:MAG: hypothetical protein JWP29_1688 [Rhodoferax sp.]|nr:hypothetical protein [Rhodoferax sp.]
MVGYEWTVSHGGFTRRAGRRTGLRQTPRHLNAFAMQACDAGPALAKPPAPSALSQALNNR